MRSPILAGAAAIAFLGRPTLAQKTQTLTQFTRADFKQALIRAGAAITSSDRPAERINLSFKDEVLADGMLLACDDAGNKTGCLGSSLLATSTPTDGAKPKQIKEANNTYNFRENFGRTYLERKARSRAACISSPTAASSARTIPGRSGCGSPR